VLFLRSPPRSFVQDLLEFDPATDTVRVVITASKLLAGADESVSPEEQARRERLRSASRGIASFEVFDLERVLVPVSGRLFVVAVGDGSFRELTGPGDAVDPRLSPDCRRVACVRGGDLWVHGVATGEARRLTDTAGGTVENGLPEFVAQEEMHRYEGFWWSRDGRFLAFQQTDTAPVEVLHIADPLHPERAPHAMRYPRAGRPNARVRLGIVDIRGGEPRWLAWDGERFPYLAAVAWAPDGRLSFLVQDRAQREQVLFAVDPALGVTSELLRERDPAFLNLAPGLPRWLADGRFLWMTERDGAWVLELRERDGGLLRALTAPELGLGGLVGVDDAAGDVLVEAGPHPPERHLFRVGLDGAPPARVSTEAGVHAANGTPARWVDTLAPRDGLVTVTVRDRAGSVRAIVPSLAEAPTLLPSPEWRTVAGLHAAVLRPTGFAPDRKWPVILHVYGGPHVRVVQATPHAFLLPQWYAEQGFVVVAFDGRGTPGRGRAFERAIAGHLVDVPLADQVGALRALGDELPELDMTRVGIQGWSFGGTMAAMAVLQYPELFRCAVAGAPVTDWSDYDTHYTERYLGLPAENHDAYTLASPVTFAGQLERPMLLVHGTADDNVHFLHSLKLSEALFRAGRTFEFLPLAGLTHMVPDPVVAIRLYSRIATFFAEHLQVRDSAPR
jgi:dipeptidyl-peptidase-4